MNCYELHELNEFKKDYGICPFCFSFLNNEGNIEKDNDN